MVLHRICINLQIGPNVAPRDSVALHVALDFSRNLIVRNSIQGQTWGIEETHGPPIALIRGQPFKLHILCDVYEFRVSSIIGSVKIRKRHIKRIAFIVLYTRLHLMERIIQK